VRDERITALGDQIDERLPEAQGSHPR